MKRSRFVAVAYWTLVVAMFSWVTVLGVRNIKYIDTLEKAVVTQLGVVRHQRAQIDSLEALLHIQEVDMDGFRTLCYLKLPEATGGGS